jgi:hypothetical protein
MLSVLGSRASEAAEGRICEGGVTGTVLPKLLRGMLFGTGGVGIFQWLTGFRGEPLSFPSPNVGDLELNQLLARLALFFSITVGCRRRKSVLTPWACGIGSDMPGMVLFAVCPRLFELGYLIDDQPEPFEVGRSSRGWRRPRQTTAITAIRAPASIPGKNPTATAPPGKRGHRGVLAAAAGVVESIPLGGVEDAVALFEVDEADGDLELPPVELVALSITHC